MVCIVLLFQDSGFKNFKYFYKHLLYNYKEEFPRLVSYERFVALKSRILPFLVLIMNSILSTGNGIFYVDSSSLAVCHTKRISRNKTFKTIGKMGKSTKGWFFGLKLHLIIDENGNLVHIKITPGNTDDRHFLRDMRKNLTGLIFGDKGYISKELFDDLLAKGLKLVTNVKKNMKSIIMTIEEKLLLRKRPIVESVLSFLKTKMELEHTRHRSVWNAFVHILSTLIAYQLKPSKPAITPINTKI